MLTADYLTHLTRLCRDDSAAAEMQGLIQSLLRQQLEGILARASAFSLELDADGVCLWATSNQAVVEAKHWVGCPLTDIFPDHAAAVDDLLQMAPTSPVPPVKRITLQLADGTYTYGVVIVPAGEHFVLVGQDISHLIHAEHALAQSQTRYEQMFHDNTVVQLLIDPDTGNIVDANRAAHAYYGYPTLIGMPIWEINTLTREQVTAEMERARAANQVFYTFRHQLASGEVRDVEVHSGPLDLNGKRLLFSIIIDITARKQAELALREREREYRTLADNIPDPLARFNRDNIILYVNPAISSLLSNGDPTSLVGKTVHETTRFTLIADLTVDAIQRVFVTGKERQLELPFRNALGEGYLQTRFVPEFDDEQRVVGVIGLSRDISELKSVQAALTDSERRLRLIADNISDMVVFVDAAQRINYINPAVEAITGYWVGDVVGMTLPRWLDDVHLADRPAVAAALRANQTPPPFRYRHAQGHDVWLEARLTTLTNDNGAFGGMVIVNRDITARIIAEAELQASRAMFKEIEDELYIQQERLQLVLDSTRDGLWDWDLATNHVHYSEGYLAMIGYQREEIEAAFDAWERLLHPDDRAPTLTALQAHIDGQTPDYQAEYRLQHKNGAWIWILDRGRVVERDADGRALRMVGIDSDITARRIAEAELRTNEARLRLVIAQLPAAIWTTDANLVIDSVAGAAITHLGVPTEQILGLHVPQAGVFGASPDYLNAYANVLQGHSLTHDSEFMGRSFRAHVEPLHNKEGQIIGTVGVALDITDYQQAQAALEAAQRQIESVVRNLPIIMFAIDPDGVFTFSDGKGLELMKLAPQQVRGQSVFDFYATTPQILADVRRALAGESLDAVYHIGETIFQTIYTALDGQGLIGVALDITEREKAAERLRLSEQRFRLLAENTSDVITLSDPDGILLYVSPSVKAAAGYDPAALVGTLSTDLVHPDDIQQVLAFRANFPQHDPRPSPARHDYRICTADGTYIWLETVSQPIIDVDGNLIQVVSASRNITERRQMEESLRLSDERYQRAAQASHVGVWEWNLENFEMYIAPNLKGMLGYGDDEIENSMLAWRQHIHPDDFDDVMERTAAHIGGLTPFFSSEHRMLTKFGDIRWFLTRGQVIFDADDRPVRVVGTDTDITELKRIQHTLEARDATLRAISTTAQRFLRVGRWRESIPAVLAALGEAARVSRVYLFEVLAQTPSDTTVIQRYEWVAEGVRSEIGNAPVANTLRNMGFGRWIDILSAGHQLAGAVADFPEAERIFLSGQAIQSLAATPIFVNDKWWGFIGYDVCFSGHMWSPVELETLQIAADTLGAAIEHEAAEQALLESEEKFRQLAAHIPEMFWVQDATSGAMLYASPAAAALVGSDPLTLFNRVHPDDQARVATERQQRPHAMNIEYRLRLDGVFERWVQVRTFPILDEGGAVYRIAGIAQDITERKAAERNTLELALERERTDILTRFIRDASHEFRTPLSIISTNLYLLQHGPQAEVHQREYAKIQQSADLILELVEALVEMVLVDSTYALTLEPLNLNNVAGQLQDGFKRHFQEGELQVVLALDADLPPSLGNLHRLYQAFAKIIENAIRYTPKGGTITLRSLVQDGYAALEIEDSGSGIDPAAMPHIFERFYREDTAHTTHGFGLGLPLAKRIIDLHNGLIEVRSEVGVGSRFRVLLPVVAAGNGG